jgi:serine/threonine protein kinase
MPQFLSKETKDLIWKMLTVDPTKRITIDGIKRHPWFTSNSFELSTIVPVERLVTA